jgi:hypothetical protein
LNSFENAINFVVFSVLEILEDQGPVQALFIEDYHTKKTNNGRHQITGGREGGREGGRFYANLAIFKLYHIEDNLISNEITLSHNVVHLAQIEIRTHNIRTSVVIGTDCIGSCKSSYHTITATMAPKCSFALNLTHHVTSLTLKGSYNVIHITNPLDIPRRKNCKLYYGCWGTRYYF